jgi:hypothetical protein
MHGIQLMRTPALCVVVVVGCSSQDGSPPLSDPHELATVASDEHLLGVGFVDDHDLVVVTQSSLRRVRFDGSEVWKVASASSSVSLIARSDLIVVVDYKNTTLSAYGTDGSVAWTTGLPSLYNVALGNVGDGAFSDQYGGVSAFDASDGTTLWRRQGPDDEGGRAVAHDNAGNIVFEVPGPLMRFDASGNPLDSWSNPTALGRLAFDANDELVETSGGPAGIVYTRFDATGAATTFVSGSGPLGTSDQDYDVAFQGDTIFEVHDTPSGSAISSLDAHGSVVWTLTKPADTHAFGATCDRGGHCAAWGDHPGCSDAQGSCSWIEVFAVP